MSGAYNRRPRCVPATTLTPTTLPRPQAAGLVVRRTNNGAVSPLSDTPLGDEEPSNFLAEQSMEFFSQLGRGLELRIT